MIFIDNYNNLKSLVSQNINACTSINSELTALIGKHITVYVDSGGTSGNGFSGILIEVLFDRIRLIASIPSKPSNQFGNKNRCEKLGTLCVIMLNHITAFNHSYY